MYISIFSPIVFPIALRGFEFLFISKLEFVYIPLRFGILNLIYQMSSDYIILYFSHKFPSYCLQCGMLFSIYFIPEKCNCCKIPEHIKIWFGSISHLVNNVYQVMGGKKYHSSVIFFISLVCFTSFILPEYTGKITIFSNLNTCLVEKS